MNQLNSGFSHLKDEELDNKVESIIAALTGNANFPNPNPTLAVITGSLTAFKNAQAMPKGAARDTQIAATRLTLAKQLDQLARNLELTPDVTDAKLATTGFDLRSPRTLTGVPVDAPANVRAKITGITGEVKVLCDGVNRAKSYHVQYSLEPNGDWADGGIFGNSRSMKVAGLQRGKDYRLRVRAIGPDGPGAWSDPAIIMPN